MAHKHLLLAAFISLSPYQLHAWNPFADQTVREYTYLTAALVSTGALAYTWLKQQSVQQHYDDFRKRFKNQEILSDCYEEALLACADYKDYADILAQNHDEEESVKRLCQRLTREYSSTPDGIAAFKRTVHERKQVLEDMRKKIERSLFDAQGSKKQALLIQQGPLLHATYSLILKTLETLSIHIPYIEAQLFMKEYEHLLQQERALAKHIQDPAQFAYNLGKIIKTKARVGERYPCRSYAQWIDQQYDLILTLKKELGDTTYYAFEEPIITYIHTTYTIFDILKQQIKVLPEFEAECAQYNAELLAQSREDENRKLKAQLTQLEENMKLIHQKNATLEAANAA